MDARRCTLCGFGLAGIGSLDICGRCSALSHRERLAIQTRKELAAALNRVAQALEIRQEGIPR